MPQPSQDRSRSESARPDGGVIPRTMRAARVHEFGPPDVIAIEQIDVPEPGDDQVLFRVHAAGVGPWDALIRSGKSGLPQPLPPTPGSDLCGTVERLGGRVSGLRPGDVVYGSTNPSFTDGYAEFAAVWARMIATKPKSLNDIEAASAPVVAVTAWQMLFDHAHAQKGQTAFVHGGAGSVGGYAVQLARWAGLHVIASAFDRDADVVRGLGAAEVVDTRSPQLAAFANRADVIIDTVGGESQGQLFDLAKPGGVIVSSVSQPSADLARQHGVRTDFFFVDVNSTDLTRLAALFDSGELKATVGTVLPLAEARTAHEMLAGKIPHRRGKIVLSMRA